MKKLTAFCFALLIVLPIETSSQGNIDWEEMWVIPHPLSSNGPFGWMYGKQRYTGIAYDKWRNVVYIVNPEMCGPNGDIPCPKIRVLNAETGYISTTVGREYGTGLPGLLSVPPDTIVTGVPGWPDSSYGGFMKGRFALYKIDLDDEGRIYVSNLVSPIWGTCIPGPFPNCDSNYLKQGPFRVYRWDAPSSSPVRVYTTLNANASAVGTPVSSEMNAYRWGDAFTVVGKRENMQPIVVDSVRIFVSGGKYLDTLSGNPELNLIITDTRANRPGNGLGPAKLDYRLGARYTSAPGFAAHGIAPTGVSFLSDIWTDRNDGPAMRNTLSFPGLPPQNIPLTWNHTIPENSVIGTGKSGPIDFFEGCFGEKYFICADGNVEDTSSALNNHTRARVMIVTTLGQEHRKSGLGDTPLLGNKKMDLISPYPNYISDVDYKIDFDPINGKPHMTLFVLMSNNGIAAFRSRMPICGWIPVELQSFTGYARDGNIRLEWNTASETQNYGFEIQRSFNRGAHWERIGFIRGNGTTTLENRYEYFDPVTDVHKNVGSVIYRLKQIDIDGRFEYSPVTSVFVSGGDRAFEFLPATNHSLPPSRISFSLIESAHVTIMLYSLLGEELGILTNGWMASGIQHVDIPLRLPSGVYLCIAHVNGVSYTTRIPVIR